MKHILLLTTGLLLCFASNGHHPYRSASASFIANGPIEILLMIDGRAVNYHPSEWVEVPRLSPGRHLVEIAAYGPRHVKHLSQMIYVRPGYKTYFRIAALGPHRRLILVKDDYHYEQRPPRRGRQWDQHINTCRIDHHRHGSSGHFHGTHQGQGGVSYSGHGRGNHRNHHGHNKEHRAGRGG